MCKQDEVHERDGLTDFLLTKLRDVLQKFPSLKLILCSAALDTELFRQYFGSCPVINRESCIFTFTQIRYETQEVLLIRLSVLFVSLKFSEVMSLVTFLIPGFLFSLTPLQSHIV